MASVRVAVLATLVAIAVSGCAQMAAFADGYVQGLEMKSAALPLYPELLIFGGPNHDVFLGCVNCQQFAADAISNSFSQYGNQFSAASLTNRFSVYGNPFSPLSPCNRFAPTAPVVVDRSGNYYGELTVNQGNPRRVRSVPLRAWIAGVCAGR